MALTAESRGRYPIRELQLIVWFSKRDRFVHNLTSEPLNHRTDLWKIKKFYRLQVFPRPDSDLDSV